MDPTTIIIIVVAAVILLAVIIFTVMRNNKINKNGIEAEAVISRIDVETQTDSEGDTSTTETFYVDYINAEGQTVTAKLGNPPFNAKQGTVLTVKYLPEKPNYVRRVK